MGWAAVRGSIDGPAIALYAGGVFWTLGYDTIYAHQDKADDMLIGVKSTALRLGTQSRTWIAGFYALAVIFWSVAGILNHNSALYEVGMLAAALHFAWQVWYADLDNADRCMAVFRSNTTLGWIVFVSTLADSFFRFM
jgi:4-hydroxybenzoate polyprenyltransferase